MNIRVYTDYDERSKRKYYRDFEVVEKLPEVGEVVWGDSDDSPSKVPPYHGERERVKSVNKAWIDCEQGSDDVYNYDYYEVATQLETYNEETGAYDVTDEAHETYYYAIKIEIPEADDEDEG